MQNNDIPFSPLFDMTPGGRNLGELRRFVSCVEARDLRSEIELESVPRDLFSNFNEEELHNPDNEMETNDSNLDFDLLYTEALNIPRPAVNAHMVGEIKSIKNAYSEQQSTPDNKENMSVNQSNKFSL